MNSKYPFTPAIPFRVLNNIGGFKVPLWIHLYLPCPESVERGLMRKRLKFWAYLHGAMALLSPNNHTTL